MHFIVNNPHSMLTGIAAEERRLHEAGTRRTVQYSYQPDDSHGSEPMSLVSEQQYPKVDRLELPHSSSEDEVRHAHRHADMLESCAGSEDEVRHAYRHTDMLELHTGSEDEEGHTHQHTDMLELHTGSEDEEGHTH